VEGASIPLLAAFNHESTDMPNPHEPRPSLDDLVERATRRVEELIDAGAPPTEILSSLASTGEALAGPGATVSILVLDRQGLLRNGASPNLPADYLAAIDRLRPDPKVGTCAAAAATGCPVITIDFREDEKWGELRHLPLALGYQGAWSMPIKSPDGRVLGTFGTYYRERRTPSPTERDGVERLAAAAARVLAAS
jgi:GAF domain-containing protein